jgi:acid stress-induced BolA-like protein IbaG/YrbA
MAIDPQKIESLIRAGFPDAQITVQGDDGTHFAAMVIDESFRGKSRVQQQRAVNATLKAEIDSGNLHALALTTKAPD